MITFSIWMAFMGITYVICEINKAMKFILILILLLGFIEILSSNIMVIIISLGLIVKVILKKS